MQRWRRRYFVLYAPPASTMLPGMCSAVLDYYDNERLLFKKGTIDLSSCVEVHVHPESEFSQNVFSLRTKHRGCDRTYYLVSDTESDMMHWVECLRAVLFLDSGFEQGREMFVRPNGNASVSSDPGERYIRVPEHSGSNSSSTSSVPSPLQASIAAGGCPLVFPVKESGEDDDGEPYILLEDCYSGQPAAAASTLPVYCAAPGGQTTSHNKILRQPRASAPLDVDPVNHSGDFVHRKVEYCNDYELESPVSSGVSPVANSDPIRLMQTSAQRKQFINFPLNYSYGDDVVLPMKRHGLSESSSSSSDDASDRDSQDEFNHEALSGRLNSIETVQYLDLDHGAGASACGHSDSKSSRFAFPTVDATDYQEIDALKTKALQVTRCEVENKRRRSSDKLMDV